MASPAKYSANQKWLVVNEHGEVDVNCSFLKMSSANAL